jgi:hypothetical protein
MAELKLEWQELPYNIYIKKVHVKTKTCVSMPGQLWCTIVLVGWRSKQGTTRCCRCMRFYPILDFTVFEWIFLFTMVYLNSVYKCILIIRVYLQRHVRCVPSRASSCCYCTFQFLVQSPWKSKSWRITFIILKSFVNDAVIASQSSKVIYRRSNIVALHTRENNTCWSDGKTEVAVTKKFHS